jgi:hypothetical protein
MKIKQAKDYYELGVLTGFHAVKDLEPGRWLLCVEGKEGRSWTLETALGKPKSFASLDSLVTEVANITGRVSSLTINAL